jgi:signal transduction histidine kinase
MRRPAFLCRWQHRRRNLSLFGRVVRHGVLLLVVELVAVAAVFALFGRPHNWQRKLEHSAAYLADRQVELLGQPDAHARELRRLYEELGVELSLYRSDGTLLASNVSPPLPPLAPAQQQKLVHGRGHHLGGPHQTLASPLVRDGQPLGYAVGRLTHWEPDYLRGLVIVLVLFATLSLASVPLARSISSPLERLTATVRRLGSGDLSARSGLQGCDEVGQLAQAFDEMAERVQALLRREKQLLADVSHELRTPLARIRVALEMAAEGDAERAQRYLAEIGVDLAELERLVTDVLAAARLELATGQPGSQAPPLRKGPLEGQQLVERAASRFRAAWPERLLQLEVEAPLPVVEADPEMLRRAIDNLLDNARKYSEAAQPILLAAHGAPEGLVVEVRDRGIGIDPADQERLFTPFFRTDRSRARGTGGVGLGLTLARRIVEAHGGGMRVTSAPGQGTTVRFHVPEAPLAGADVEVA